MKLIIKPEEINKEFLRLLRQYSKYYWLMAWAGHGSEPFKELVRKSSRIEKVIVGIHFYQTHPEFIETFLENKNVRYIMQPSGTFHPKMYLFYNSDDDWELLSGSFNFTKAAFTVNEEAGILIKSNEVDSDKVLKSFFAILYKNWTNGKYFDIEGLENYRTAWKNHRSKIRSLSGKYGKKGERGKEPDPIFRVGVLKMGWDDYINGIFNPEIGTGEARIDLITEVTKLFLKNNHFNELSGDERKFIGGVPNKHIDRTIVDWGYFGAMTGNARFKGAIDKNNIKISYALDEIPLHGQVSKQNYLNYIDIYSSVFDGLYLATATRLLAMKRPDIFVCVDSKNKKKLCKEFGIYQNQLDYYTYWDDVIERIRDADWWLNPKPRNKKEQIISNARAAFIDAYYYEGLG